MNVQKTDKKVTTNEQANRQTNRGMNFKPKGKHRYHRMEKN